MSEAAGTQKRYDPWEGEDDGVDRNACFGFLNPLRIEQELYKTMNGLGGKVDQKYLYTSPLSAMCWMQETALEEYRVANSIPVELLVKEVVRRIQKFVPEQDRLKMISLGSGEALQEQRIIQTLIQKEVLNTIKLYLIDSSYSLLYAGFETCEQVFGQYPNIKPTALYQDFTTLQQNRRFLTSLYQTNEVKLITMLGKTFSNLEEEIFFVRNTLNLFPSKTLLLFDVVLPYASSESIEEIKIKDPWLQGRPPWARLGERRWAIPFTQYHPLVKSQEDIRFVPVLDNRTCQIKGSYAIEIRAYIQEQQFTVQRLKRHSIEGLMQGFKEEGWSFISSYPFYNDRCAAVLFQKD